MHASAVLRYRFTVWIFICGVSGSMPGTMLHSQRSETVPSQVSPSARERRWPWRRSTSCWSPPAATITGQNKLVVLGDTNLEQARELPEGLRRFLAETRT